MPPTNLVDIPFHIEEETKGLWKIYVYDEHGQPDGGRWFPTEMYPVEEAKLDAVEATFEDRQVRVLDGADLLVFHTKDGEIICGEGFWETIAG